MKNMPEIELSSPMELIELLDRFGETPDLLFRGQSAQYDELTTTIERHKFDKEDIARFKGVASHVFREGMLPGHSLYGHLTEAEAYLLRLFQSRAQHHLAKVPQNHESTAWLALMQHYGAPTRLLDVTKSLLVAAYFATEHPTRYPGIVYVFFTPKLALQNTYVDGQPQYDRYVAGQARRDPSISGLISQDEEFAKKVTELDKAREWEIKDSQLADWAIQMNGCFPNRLNNGDRNLKGILQLENRYPTQREIAQQGCFLMPLSLMEPLQHHIDFTYQFMNPKSKVVPMRLEQVELQDFDEHWPIMKIRIPRENFRLFKISLKHMGITPEMLFPDFDGLAKSMHGQLVWHKEVNGMVF